MSLKIRIDKKLERKGNTELAETILLAKKQKAWLKIGNILAYPRRKKVTANLDKIDKESKEGDTIIVPGKVLGQGEISKKIVLVAFSFSEEAEKKLKAKKCEIKSIKEEIKANKNLQGVKIII
jgi:large subunit ribosomal protein L18e